MNMRLESTSETSCRLVRNMSAVTDPLEAATMLLREGLISSVLIVCLVMEESLT